MPECHCLLAGEHCVLPEECDGTPAHTMYHQGGVTAESCRPYPLGARSHGPDFPVALARPGLLNVEMDLQRNFFTSARQSGGSALSFSARRGVVWPYLV